MRLRGVDHTQTPGDHDRLVVAALLLLQIRLPRAAVGNGLLVFAEIAEQIRAAKFVVERRTTERPLDHDLQRAGDVTGLAV